MKDISLPISKDLEKFNKFMKENLRSDVQIINSILNYMLKSRGKQYRAILCLLCSRLMGENPNNQSFLSACMVEILHVATLLHDDVVDDSNIRRGWPAINKIWKNKLSILIGDYLFSQALINISKLNDLHCIDILSNISKRLSEGEIMQIEKAMKKNMTEQEYFKMVGDKTASLISASCYLGFYSNTKDKKFGSEIKEFGEYLGIAYQLKDDIFDIIGNINNIGKPSNLDLKKNMLTLPYIYSLSIMNKKEKKAFLIKIRRYASRGDIKTIKNMIIESGGIEYANNKVQELSEKAKKKLEKIPDSLYKEALIKTVDFNIQRTY